MQHLSSPVESPRVISRIISFHDTGHFERFPLFSGAYFPDTAIPVLRHIHLDMRNLGNDLPLFEIQTVLRLFPCSFR